MIFWTHRKLIDLLHVFFNQTKHCTIKTSAIVDHGWTHKNPDAAEIITIINKLLLCSIYLPLHY